MQPSYRSSLNEKFRFNIINKARNLGLVFKKSNRRTDAYLRGKKNKLILEYINRRYVRLKHGFI